MEEMAHDPEAELVGIRVHAVSAVSEDIQHIQGLQSWLTPSTS